MAKLIQIMPNSNFTAAAFGPSGEGKNPDEPYDETIEAWGLYDDGTAVALVCMDDGTLMPVTAFDNFEGVKV